MTDTYTLAFGACGAYFTATGKMPTVESIKAEIGIKSPTTISTAIKDWKAALARSLEENQAAIAGIPPGLKDAFVAVWQQAQAESAAAYQERLAGLADREAALAAKERELASEQARTGQLVALTEQRYQEETKALHNETVRLSEEAATLKEAAGQLQQRATDAELAVAVLSEQVRQEQDKVRRLEAQYDGQHTWMLRRIEEEKERHRQHTQHEMARLTSEATRSKQDTELLKAKLDQALAQATAERDRGVGLERELSDLKLKLAGMTLNEAKLQNEINKKDETIRQISLKNQKSNIKPIR
jgi:chromosome segregation ATPase